MFRLGADGNECSGRASLNTTDYTFTGMDVDFMSRAHITYKSHKIFRFYSHCADRR